MGRYDLDAFVADCRAAGSMEATTEVVARAVERRADVLAAIGDIREHAQRTLYHSATLTVQWLCWAPGMSAPPHDHRMWAVVGVLAGCEVNREWQRTARGLARTTTREVQPGDVCVMTDDVIHDVVNPRDAFTFALHVYGGDILHLPRSLWNPVTGREEPFDGAQVEELTRELNARQRAAAVPFAAANIPEIMRDLMARRGGTAS